MTTRVDPDDAAARWIALRQSGEMSADRWQEYSAWLGQSEKNRNAIAQYESMLSSVDAAGDSELAEEFERQLHEEFENHVAAKQHRTSMPWRAIAASVALAILASGSLYVAQPYLQKPVVYASHIGEQVSVALDDGSTATLNTNSALAVKFSGGKRGVEIRKGEALFDVARDASRPFVVATSLGKIQVTGTVFNVRALAGETVVHVVSGHVTVLPKDGGSVSLTAGQGVRLNSDGVSMTTFDPDEALAWREHKARYRDEPLGEVIADLNRYFVTPIVLENPSLEALPVTGEFDLTDQKTAVVALTTAFDLASRESAEQILITPNNSN